MSWKHMIFLVHDFLRKSNSFTRWLPSNNALRASNKLSSPCHCRKICNLGKVEFQSKKQLLQDLNIVKCWLLPLWRADCTVQNVHDLNYKNLIYFFFGFATCCLLLRATLEEAQGLFLKTEENWALGQATRHGPELCDLCHTFKLDKTYVHAGKCAFFTLFPHEHL